MRELVLRIGLGIETRPHLQSGLREIIPGDQSDDTEVVFPGKYLEASVRMELERPEGPISRGGLK